MKKALMLGILAVVCLGFYSTAVLAAGFGPTVVDSPHNFSITGGFQFQSTTTDQVCIFCHTPHQALTQATINSTTDRLPLWNRTMDQFPATAFNMYSSSTFSATADPKPNAYSLMCLSCHDGISSISLVINNGGSSLGPMTPADTLSGAETGLPGDPIAKVDIGRDLSNDHPISFVYDSTLDPTGLKDPGVDGANIGPLRLFNQKVECCTCHDPHDDYTNPPFLRMSNAGSGLCNQCHNK